jgi:cell division protein ZapA (FtsZ GTPase activity inhibitor)
MQAVLKVLGEEIRLECAPDERRRLEDLAAALEARLVRLGGEAGGRRRLVLAALALMDEAQAAAAALARARCEIERLSDLVAEAKLETAALSPSEERVRSEAVRVVLAAGAA